MIYTAIINKFTNILYKSLQLSAAVKYIAMFA